MHRILLALAGDWYIRLMDDSRLYDACLIVCDKLGIEVSITKIADIADDEMVITANGGLCRVNDKWRIIVPSQLDTAKQARTLALALTHFDLDDIFLPPALRERLTTLHNNELHRTNTQLHA